MSQLKNRKGKSPIKKRDVFTYDAQITISKITSNKTPEYIQIHINTKDKIHIFAEVTPHDFGLAITGLGYVPCKLTIE